MSNLTITYTKKKRKRSLSHNPVEFPPNTCFFCRSQEDSEEDFGKIIKKCGFTVHYFCMLFASGLSQSGKTETQGIYGFMPADIRRELSRGSRLRCTYCKDKGATIGCVVTSCRKAFHLTCGRRKGSLHQFFDSFRSYCPDHRPRQTVQISDRLAFVGTANTVCSICMYAVVARTSNDTLRAPCCKNSWFHRSCIQRYAMSAGLYFFKCPLCNSKDLFQTEMLQYGIYIPDQDAAWEREPNAFQDLYEQYAHCDAPKCKCPQGRDYDEDNTKWEVLVCEFCGSKGSHSACNGLKRLKKEYICMECRDIDSKAKEAKGHGKKKTPKVRNRTQAELQQLLEDRVAEIVKQKNKSEQNNQHTKETPKSKSTAPAVTPLSKQSTTMSWKTSPISTDLGNPEIHIMQKMDTDTEVDIEASDSDEKDGSSSSSQSHKRRRLSVSVTRSNSKKNTRQSSTLSSNVEVEASGDSCSASIKTKTTKGKYSNYVTLSTVTDSDVRKWGTSDSHKQESSSRLHQSSGVGFASDEDSSTTGSYSDSDSDSEICAVDEVHEDSSKKTVTIKWKGKKIRIYKEVEKDDRDDISKWSLHLEVGDSEDHKPSPSRTPYEHRSESKMEESPPQLVPIDDEITIRCTPPTRPYMLNMHPNSMSDEQSRCPRECTSKTTEPPVLCPVWEEEEEFGESRVTRSMSIEGKRSSSLDSNKSSSSVELGGHKGMCDRNSGHLRRSLERSFTYQDYCQSVISSRHRWDDADSISSIANSIITLSSNASENGDDESDCLIVEPVYITENEKRIQDGRVSYSAQIAVGSPFKDDSYPEAVPYKQITKGNGSVGVVIDLTGSPTEAWEGLADTDINLPS